VPASCSRQDGFLTTQDENQHVLGYAENGTLSDISLTGLKAKPGQGTSSVVLQGNLSSHAHDLHARQR